MVSPEGQGEGSSAVLAHSHSIVRDPHRSLQSASTKDEDEVWHSCVMMPYRRIITGIGGLEHKNVERKTFLFY